MSHSCIKTKNTELIRQLQWSTYRNNRIFVNSYSYKQWKLKSRQRSYLYCTIITACADELWSTTGWIASVHKGGVSFQTLDPLTCFTVPHTHGLVCAR